MAEYIDRDLALNMDLSVECQPEELEPLMRGMNLVFQHIKELPVSGGEVGEPKIGYDGWIPVTERLPKIMHTVIVSGRMKYKWETDFFRFVDVATYTEGEFFETFNDWYEGQDEFEITHWMSLPEPPKEGEA